MKNIFKTFITNTDDRTSVKKVVGFSLLIATLFNIVVYMFPENTTLRVLFGIPYLLIIPGLLLEFSLSLRMKSLTQWVVTSVGLSLFILMIGGLVINILLPALGYDRPLRTFPLLLFFDALLAVMGVFAYKKSRTRLPKITYTASTAISKLVWTIALLLPILSFFGAQLINNGGPPIITMLAIGTTVLLITIVTMARNKIHDSMYPFVLYGIALASILMFTARTNHIIGWDIHEEFQVFQLTYNNSSWSPQNLFGNAYNACLSITILPTILKSLLGLGGETIFKMIPPLIFSLTPLAIYIAARVYANPIKSFMIALVFVVQIWFMMVMPELMRQQIAMFLFALLVMTITAPDNSKAQQRTLFLLLSIGIVVSHYSTSYMFGALLVIYGVLLLLLKTALWRKVSLSHTITAPLAIAVIIATVFWNIQYTVSSTNLSSTGTNVFANMKNIFSSETLKSGAERIIFKPIPVTSPEKALKNYQTVTKNFKEKHPQFDYYPESSYAGYAPIPVAQTDKAGLHIPYAKEAAGKLTQIMKVFISLLFPLIGLGALLYRRYREKKPDTYLVLALSTLPLLALILFLPLLKLTYNIERVYMQSLVLLAYPTIIGAFVLLRRSRYAHGLVATLLILFFLQSSGLITQIVGGTAQLNLNSDGPGYTKYAVNMGEVTSAQWLAKHRNKSHPVHADEVANLRLVSYGLINNEVLFDIYPSTIAKNGYVYESSANLHMGSTGTAYNLLTDANVRSGLGYTVYEYPKNFIEDNKNAIYSSGSSRIMR